MRAVAAVGDGLGGRPGALMAAVLAGDGAGVSVAYARVDGVRRPVTTWPTDSGRVSGGVAATVAGPVLMAWPAHGNRGPWCRWGNGGGVVGGGREGWKATAVAGRRGCGRGAAAWCGGCERGGGAADGPSQRAAAADTVRCYGGG
ncbi:uncharacterized protein A4U43_C06F14100 [Asparagus officinalis]|uniref:Uncharacterized protein n=1 Tax=Asparagus officinalis TaxID=4686 RepID=A0A5P1ELT2_ASPOF|nr:uncharacterized protein A4U43_C06F14100 [Asparagus officinalis]